MAAKLAAGDGRSGRALTIWRMNIFASYFWLWSIIGLLLLGLLYTLVSLLNFAGFMTPVRLLTRRMEQVSPMARLWLLGLVMILVAYPSFVHKLWADATANEIRQQFSSIPAYPGAQRASPTEQLGGLYDPAGTSGTFILDYFGTQASADDVRAYYRNELAAKGWTTVATDGRTERFIDGPATIRSHYELVLAVSQPGSASIPSSLAAEPTVYALRFGAVDPRVTTQVAWFVDCLVRAAPTFPSCEAMGWHPIESAGRGTGRALVR